MAKSPAELEAVFDDSFPNKVQEALIKCLFGSYRTSFDECSKFPKEEAHDLRPFYRWVQLRADLRGIADRFPSVTSSAEPYHTLLAAGHVRLTASSVTDPQDLVRPAIYRQTYANESQMDLFLQDTPPPHGASIYAILLHGPDPIEHRQPSFANVVFPSKDCRSYVHEIDLFARHKSLVESLSIQSEESHEPEPQVKLRKLDAQQES